MELFGFKIVKTKEEEKKENLPSFTPKQIDDGAVILAPGGAWGTYVDIEGSIKSEAELVTKYREMMNNHEIESAVDDIVNESIISEDVENIVNIELDDIEYIPTNLKKVIQNEFSEVLKLFVFKTEAYEVFRRWYVDGRLYYHVIIDEKDPSKGIQEMRYIDPRKIRKVREVKRNREPGANTTIVQTKNEYYVYNEKGFMSPRASSYTGASPSTGASGVKIAEDSIVHCTSGLMDQFNKLVLSYLHKAIKPLNQLRTLEDATLIYRISRAPERRIFYIDVGDMPKAKAEQYVRDIMIKFKNKLVYDSNTGEVRDDRKFMTMLEDFWLPRRNGGRGTEITTLPAGQNLGEMEDVKYFQKKLFSALGVPVTRLDPESTFNFGKPTEITRDEVKFHKFIARLRTRFNQLFLKTLEKQLVLKRILTTQEWAEIKNDIKFRYAEDNFFSELKDVELMNGRLNILNQIQPFIGRLYSNTWVRKNILRQDEKDIEQMNDEIAKEMTMPQYQTADPNAPQEPSPQDITNSNEAPIEDAEVLNEMENFVNISETEEFVTDDDVEEIKLLLKEMRNG